MIELQPFAMLYQRTERQTTSHEEDRRHAYLRAQNTTDLPQARSPWLALVAILAAAIALPVIAVISLSA